MQVLAPMYKTVNGIDLLNVSLQEVFNPKAKGKKEIIINNVLFREKDKVIQLTNMPDENVFNGDIGYIESIENGTKKEILINFDGNLVRYTSANFNKFKHAYAISIHKSQGSEFDTVILPIVKGYGKMLYSEDEYTKLLGQSIINGYEVFLYQIDEKLQAVFQDNQFIYFIDSNMNETEVIKIVEEMR